MAVRGDNNSRQCLLHPLLSTQQGRALRQPQGHTTTRPTSGLPPSAFFSRNVVCGAGPSAKKRRIRLRCGWAFVRFLITNRLFVRPVESGVPDVHGPPILYMQQSAHCNEKAHQEKPTVCKRNPACLGLHNQATWSRKNGIPSLAAS